MDTHVRDDTVERRALEVERLARLADALLAGAQGTEVLGRLRDDVGAERHLDAARGLAANGHVKVHHGIRPDASGCTAKPHESYAGVNRSSARAHIIL